MAVSGSNKRIAIIAANGFDENHMTAIQRQLTQAKLAFTVVAPEQGLVNGWQGNGWGHYFTVDLSISTALGSDFDSLILIGGERGVAKLKTNPHTRRIVNHFVEADKPVAAIADSVALLALSESIANHTLASNEAAKADVTLGKAILSPDDQELDGHILTSNGADIEGWAGAVVEMISNYEIAMDVAA
jgi:protease I